jgi:hypothetical protein
LKLHIKHQYAPFGITCLLLLSSCASTSVQMLGDQKYSAKNADCDIDVYTSEAKVEKKYKEIAMVTYKTKQDAFSDKGAGKIIPELKEAACEIGADGIVVRSVQQGSWGSPGNGEAIAIKYH